MSLEEYEEGQYLTPDDEDKSDKPSDNYILNSRPYHQHGRGRSFHQGYWRGRSFWGRGKPFRGTFQANTRKNRKSLENEHEQENRSPNSSLERSRDSKERSRDSKERSYSRSYRPSREKSPTSSRRSKSRGRSNRTNSHERSHRTLSRERSHHGHRSQDKYRSRSRDRIRSRSPRHNTSGRTQKGYNREETRQLNNSRDNSDNRESHNKNNRNHHCNKRDHSKNSRDRSKNCRDRHKSDESQPGQFENKRRSAELRENGLPIESECKYSPNMNDKQMDMSNDWSSKKRHNSSPVENEMIKEENDRRDNKRRNLIWSQRESEREHSNVQHFVEEGLREIRFGEKGRPIKKEYTGVNKRKELRNRNRMENYVLTSVDIECLHKRNDRYHFYRVPNKSSDTTSSSTTSNDAAMLDNCFKNTKTETSDNTVVFDNSFKNTKSRTSNVMNIAKGISKVCQGRITADGKRSFTDIKEEERYNDKNDGKTINQTNEGKQNVQHSERVHSKEDTVDGGKSFNFHRRQNSCSNENKYEPSTNQIEAFTNQLQSVSETNQLFCHDQISNRESNYRYSNDLYTMHCNNIDTTMHSDVRTDKPRRYVQPDEAGDNVPYFTNISRSKTLVKKLNSRQPLLPTPASRDSFVHDYHCSSSNQHNLSETPQICHNPPDQIHPNIPDKEKIDSVIDWFMRNNSNRLNSSKELPENDSSVNAAEKSDINTSQSHTLKTDINDKSYNAESSLQDTSEIASPSTSLKYQEVQSDGHHIYTPFANFYEQSENKEERDQSKKSKLNLKITVTSKSSSGDNNNNVHRVRDRKSNKVSENRDRKSNKVSENRDAKSDNLTENKNNKSSNVTENTEKPSHKNSQNSNPSEITCSRTTGLSKTTSHSVTKSKLSEGKGGLLISGEQKNQTSQSSKSSKEKKHSSGLKIKSKEQTSKSKDKSEKSSCEKMMQETEKKKSLVLNPNINHRNVPTSPKTNSFTKDKLTSTPVTIGKTMSCEKDLFLSPVLNPKTLSGSKEKKRHTSGSNETPSKCMIMSETLSESDCSANSLMVVDSWHEGTSGEKSKHSSDLHSKDVSSDKEMVDIEEEADTNQNIFDKIVHKKKSEKRSRSPLRLSEIKKINSDKKALKAKHGHHQSIDKDPETKVLLEKSNNLNNEKKTLKKEHKRRKEEMHQNSKPLSSSSNDKSKVVSSCEKLNEASLLKKNDVNSTPTRLKVTSIHEKSKTIDKSETCDNSKMTSSFDTSDITSPPVHSLFGRKIRTGLEDLPFINTPKKDKSCEGKSNESGKGSTNNIPENLFHKMKKKLSQTNNVVKRLDPAKTKTVKLGTGIQTEETTNQNDKRDSEKQKENELCERQQQTNKEKNKEMKNQKDKTGMDLNIDIHRSAKTHDRKDNSKSIEHKSLKQHKPKQGEKIIQNSHDKSKSSSACGVKEGERQSVEKEHQTRKEKAQNDNTKIKSTNIDNCKNKLTGSKDKTVMTPKTNEVSENIDGNVLMSGEMCKVGNKRRDVHNKTGSFMINKKGKQNNHNHIDCYVESSVDNNEDNQKNVDDENPSTMECSDKSCADEYNAETTVSTDESFECFGIIENVDLNTVSLSADELERLENVQNVEVSLENSLTTSKIGEIDIDQKSHNMTTSSLGAEEIDEDELLRDMEVNCLDVSEEVIVQTSFEENSEKTEGCCQLSNKTGDVSPEDNYTETICLTGDTSQETDLVSGTSDKILPSSSIVEEVEVCTTEELLPCHYEQLEVVTEEATETAELLNVKNCGSLVENTNNVDISLHQITTSDKSPDQINTSDSNVSLDTLEKNSHLTIGDKTKESQQKSAFVDAVKLSETKTISELNSVSVDTPQPIASKSITALKSTKDSDGTFEKMEINSKKQKLLEMLNPERNVEMKEGKRSNLSLTSKHCDSTVSHEKDKDSSNHINDTSDQKLKTVHKSERKMQNVKELSNKSEHVTKASEQLTISSKVVKCVSMKSPVRPMLLTNRNKSSGSGFVRHHLPPNVSDNRGKSAKANILKDWKMSDKIMPLKQSEKHKKLPSENKYKSSGVTSVGKVKTQNNSPSLKQKKSLWKDLRKFEGKTIKRKQTNTSLPKAKASVCTDSKVSGKTDKPIAKKGQDTTLRTGTSNNNQGVTLETDTNIENDMVGNNKNDAANAQKVVEDNCGEGDSCGLKIISVCGNVNFDEPEQNSSEDEEELLEYVKNMNERPVTPSLDNIDMIMNSSPLRKYDKTTKKDSEKNNDQSKLVVVTMPSLIHKGTRKDSLTASFVPMETNNSTTDESELDSSCDKLVIDTEQSDSKLSGGSSVEVEQTNISLSNEKENSEGTTETVELLKELSTVDSTTKSMHNTESGNDMSEIVHNVESGNKMLEDVHNAKYGNERSESVLNTEPGNDMSKSMQNTKPGNDMSKSMQNTESGNDMSEGVQKAESLNDMSESVQVEENCKAPSTTKDSSSLSDDGSKCIDNDETLIYAHNTSDMESSKETIDYSQDHQNKVESENLEHDLEEYSDGDFDEDDDDIQIMWYIKGVPQSPWTPATPHIKEEGTNEGEEEDDEFKQPPVLPELDEYFKKNPEIFSQTKAGNDTSGTNPCVCSYLRAVIFVYVRSGICFNSYSFVFDRSLYCGENTSQQDDKASKLAKKHWKEIHSNQNTQHNVHPVHIVVNQNQYTAGQYQAGQQVCQQSGNKDRQYQPAQQVCQQLGNKDRQYQPAQQMPVSQQSNNTAGHYPYPVAPQIPTYQKSVNTARQYQNQATHQHLGNLPAYQQQNTHQGDAIANPLSNIHPSSNRGIIPHNIQDTNQRAPHHTTTYVISSNPYQPTFQPTSQNEVTNQPTYPQVIPSSYANQPMFQPTGQSSQIGTSQSTFQPSRQPSQVIGNYHTLQTGSQPINRTNMQVPTMQPSVQTSQPMVNSQMNYLYNSNAVYERQTDNVAGENRSTLPRQESRVNVNKTSPLLRQMVCSDTSSCSVSNLPQRTDGNTNQQSVFSDAHQTMTRTPSQKNRSSSNIENSSPLLANGVSNRSLSVDSNRNKTPPSCRTTPDLPGINGQSSSFSSNDRQSSPSADGQNPAFYSNGKQSSLSAKRRKFFDSDIPKVRRKLSTTSQEDDGQQNKECSIGIPTDDKLSLQKSTLSTSGLSATPPTKQLETTLSTSGLEASPSTSGLVASPSTSGQVATSSTSGLVASPSTSRQFVTPSKSGLVASPFISELAVSLSKSGLSTPPCTSGLAKTPSTSELTKTPTTSEVANTSSTLELKSSLASGNTASVTTPSRSSEGQNFMRQLNFQRPEDIIKAFRFGQEIQLQAMNKMMELMKKDKENYEQLEKELETEKASHVNAQQKLEQLETQFGSIMDCLHKKS
ncbi:Hypothetical predicted protein [Mytilus galloprovincialis]|uniref:Uncharacterized protein n=1 Tax=Mytilus galloprovincialis TaxID=29158 RepID=A0A8B6EPM0_MYTGA|nr:Hypothetical predicted protein [Mytilus galloprovincialis]